MKSSEKKTRYGVHIYSMVDVRSETNKNQNISLYPDTRLDGHTSPITSMSYGPYNNGPLTSMCEGGCIKVWGGEGSRSSSPPTRSQSPLFHAEQGIITMEEVIGTCCCCCCFWKMIVPFFFFF